MQRTAVQGSPAILAGVTGTWFKDAPTDVSEPHPFRYSFTDLEIGKTIETATRTTQFLAASGAARAAMNQHRQRRPVAR